MFGDIAVSFKTGGNRIQDSRQFRAGYAIVLFHLAWLNMQL